MNVVSPTLSVKKPKTPSMSATAERALQQAQARVVQPLVRWLALRRMAALAAVQMRVAMLIGLIRSTLANPRRMGVGGGYNRRSVSIPGRRTPPRRSVRRPSPPRRVVRPAPRPKARPKPTPRPQPKPRPRVSAVQSRAAAQRAAAALEAERQAAARAAQVERDMVVRLKAEAAAIEATRKAREAAQKATAEAARQRAAAALEAERKAAAQRAAAALEAERQAAARAAQAEKDRVAALKRQHAATSTAKNENPAYRLSQAGTPALEYDARSWQGSSKPGQTQKPQPKKAEVPPGLLKHLLPEDWLAAQGKYDKLKPPSAETMDKIAQVPAFEPKPTANGGARATPQISPAQQNNDIVCTPDNPHGNPFYDPTAVDNIEQYKVTTIEIPRYVPGEPAIDPPGHDKAVQGNGWVALAELIGVINDIVGPYVPPATSDIHTSFYRSIYENGDVRYPGLVITNTSETSLYFRRIDFIIDRSGNPVLPTESDLHNLETPMPTTIRFVDVNIVISPGATETIEIPVETLPLNQPLIATSIYLRVYIKGLGVRVIKVDFP